MKVAFATQDLKHVDAHFGWAKNIAVYEITPEGHRFVEVFQFEGDLREDGNEDKLAAQDRRHQGLRDSLCRRHRRLGRGARGRHRIFIRSRSTSPRRSRISSTSCVAVLKGTPPPWLRKAMLKGTGTRVRFGG